MFRKETNVSFNIRDLHALTVVYLQLPRRRRHLPDAHHHNATDQETFLVETQFLLHLAEQKHAG